MLTRRQRDLLFQLWFREADPGEPCWLVAAGGGRYVLLVLTMMGTWERHSRVSLTTLRILHSAGHITYGQPTKMPAWFTPQEGEESAGREITITDKGCRAIGQPTDRQNTEGNTDDPR
ncbi:MAG: hypothetical protein LC792_17670 [Actinobacteria bacterium]|nr:hypothetical protein [Actinomycetota bacterium]